MRTLVDTPVPLPGLSTLRSPLATALEKALAGADISEAHATALLGTEGGEAAALLAVAGHLRDQLCGTTVTYSPKVFLPVTNLCRNRCSYCTFRKDPGDPEAWTMDPAEIRAWCRRGHAEGCIEALMCLGDKPERVSRTYRETLQERGCASTVDYVERACAIALDEGLLPHTNAGVLTRAEMARIKPVNVSMGLMLETISERLCARGGPHHQAPDKRPAVRLQMLRDAGELQIPFTTGILVGIGETRAERVQSLLAIRALHRRYGHIQEVIIQNFRAKPATPMAAAAEPDSLELARTVAVARLLLRDMNIQAPPNLSPYDHRLLLGAGINDWGGISPLTADYVNPEARWPHRTALADTCRAAGFTLRERLPIYAGYLQRPGFLDPALHAPVQAIAAQRGLTQ